MLQSSARRLLSRHVHSGRQLGPAGTSLNTAKGSEEAYELLPPGCSLKDPSYGEE